MLNILDGLFHFSTHLYLVRSCRVVRFCRLHAGLVLGARGGLARSARSLRLMMISFSMPPSPYIIRKTREPDGVDTGIPFRDKPPMPVST